MNGAEVPTSVQPPAHSSTARRRLLPGEACVSTLSPGSDVVSVTPDRSMDPSLDRSTARWTVSPGARSDAPTSSRLAELSVAPRAM